MLVGGVGVETIVDADIVAAVAIGAGLVVYLEAKRSRGGTEVKPRVFVVGIVGVSARVEDGVASLPVDG